MEHSLRQQRFLLTIESIYSSSHCEPLLILFTPLLTNFSFDSLRGVPTARCHHVFLIFCVSPDVPLPRRPFPRTRPSSDFPWEISLMLQLFVISVMRLHTTIMLSRSYTSSSIIVLRPLFISVLYVSDLPPIGRCAHRLLEALVNFKHLCTSL